MMTGTRKTQAPMFLEVDLNVNHALNHFTCNISYVSLPLMREEIFIDKKRGQVKTNNHVFMICI